MTGSRLFDGEYTDELNHLEWDPVESVQLRRQDRKTAEVSGGAALPFVLEIPLEHPDRVSPTQHCVNLIFLRNRCEVDGVSAVLSDEVDRKM